MLTFSRRWALAFSLTLAAGGSVATRAQTTNESKGTSTISGRVTAGDDKGVPGLALALMPAQRGPEWKPAARATTDADGRYLMTGVPAGRYRLMPLARHYRAATQISGWDDGGRAINLAASDAVENEDFKLERGGVITGRVTDADGQPVIGEHLLITAAADRTERRDDVDYVVAPFAFETDDRGVYRVYGLPAGRYHVSVGPDREGGMMRVGPGTKAHRRTFHPNVTDASRARAVEVTAGGETTGIDITTADAPKGFAASGRVVDADTGKPIAGVRYGFGFLRAGENAVRSWNSDGRMSEADGGFILKNLAPGRYAAFAYHEGAGGDYSDAVIFEIEDDDLDGLVIKTRRGGSLSGTVVVEGTTDRSVLAQLGRLTLHARVNPPEKTGATVSAPIQSRSQIGAGGQFHIGGLRPGKTQLFLWGWPSPKGFTITRIERGGVELIGGIEVRAGEQITGLRVHLAYGVSVVRGRIEVRQDGQPTLPPENLRLHVIAKRLGAGGNAAPPQQQWSLNASEVDSRGYFILEDLVGGDYELQVRGWPVGPTGGRATGPLPVVTQVVNVPETGETTIIIVYELSPKP